MIASVGARARFGNLSAFALLALASAGLPLGCSKKQAAKQTAGAQQPVKPAPPPAKCDPGPDGHCQPSPSCSPTCQLLATPECLKCESEGDCNIFANNCEDPQLSPADRAVCYDILTCLQTTNCFDGPTTTLGSCYCGELPLKQCLAAPWTGPGAPDGVCRDVILKGMPKATEHRHVLGNLTTRVNAAGLALSRLNCQKIGYRRQCANACGFGPVAPEPLPPQPRPDH